MKKINQLTAGGVVTFSKVPCGSYTKPAVPYLIERNSSRQVYFRNTMTGGGTYDQAWAIEHAEFEMKAAA